VEQVCRELEVSRSGYYGWQKGSPSERSRRNQALRRRLVELHEKYPAMGLDSLYHLLKPEFGCSRKRVHRQMRIAGISSARRRVYKATTNSNYSHLIAPNLLMRKLLFYASGPSLGGRYYVHSHRRGLAVPGNRERFVYQEDCGVRFL